MPPDVARRSFPWFVLLLTLLVLPLAEGAKNEKRAERRAAQATAAPAKPVASVGQRNQVWHTWTDVSGRTVEAIFCGLSGEFITLQTRDGKTYHFNGNILCAADQEFARQCVTAGRAAAFTPAVIASAAADVDRLVLAVLEANGKQPNGPASDEQFLRRLYVDALGRVPTAAEATAFLSDRTADKRARLIDRLVYSPGYTMQMFNWMADLLRVKDTFGKGVPAFTFEDWLKSRIAANAPWDQLVREMLTADGRLTDNGAAGFMLFDAEMPLDGVSNLMTTFLGTNMACAQCHDHPLAEWKQRDFYQMAAFFGATDGKDEGVVAEIRKAMRNDDSVGKAVVRRIAEINAFRLADLNRNKLTLPKDYKYDDAKPGSPVSPSLIVWREEDAASPVYKVDTSRPSGLRDEFARWLTSPDNPRFATNIANRLWKKSFGLAVQEPVDDIDDPQAAASPELLAHLTTVMKAARFDLREFQRVLYNTQAYQRAASPSPDLSKGPYLFNGPIVRRLTAEQAWDSLMVSAIGSVADDILLRRGETMAQLALPEGKITAEKVREVATKLAKMRAGGKKAVGGSNAGLANGYEGERPRARFGLMLARASELPQPAPETHFLRLFGQGDRLLADSSTTDGSVPQVLQMMNGAMGRLVADGESTAVLAAAKERDPAARVTSLYLAYLSRRPTPTELAAAGRSLESGLSLADLAWVLANTREFLFIQ